MCKKNIIESGNTSARKEYRSPVAKTVRIGAASLICISQLGINNEGANEGEEAW